MDTTSSDLVSVVKDCICGSPYGRYTYISDYGSTYFIVVTEYEIEEIYAIVYHRPLNHLSKTVLTTIEPALWVSGGCLIGYGVELSYEKISELTGRINLPDEVQATLSMMDQHRYAHFVHIHSLRYQ